LNISPSTVSRALRDGYEISAETKKNVLEYAEKVNYRSNPHALCLKNKRSFSIGIVISEVANSFFSQAIAGIESIAHENGYHTIISQTNDNYEKEISIVNHLASRSVDGLLVSLSSETKDYSHFTALHDNGLPIIFFDRIMNNIETFKVTTNNFKGAYTATELLIKDGYRNIAHLANAPQLSITNERIKGYMAALEDNDIPFNADLIRFCYKGGKDQTEIEEAMNALFKCDPRVDAVFTASDSLSVGCLRALKKYSLGFDTIPVIGFTNSDVVDLLQPPMSYVKQPAFEMGQLSMQLLLQILDSKYPITEFDTKVLDSEIYYRNEKVISY
jgi:LacI family transcriptional regulator